MSSSADWVISGPDHALAFLLADSGYDVWMGNFRGNTYSKDHIDPDITKEDYWVNQNKLKCDKKCSSIVISPING